MDALMLGNLIMLVSGSLASFPKAARWSGTRWFSFNFSGNEAIILPAKEISLVSISIPAL